MNEPRRIVGLITRMEVGGSSRQAILRTRAIEAKQILSGKRPHWLVGVAILAATVA